MRVTKEEFTKAINALQTQFNYDKEWAKKVGEVFPAAFDANLLYNNREVTEGLESLLESLTGDEDTKWIEYFIYECDFGNKELECRHEDGTTFILKTPEDVYDLLESNMKEGEGYAQKLPMYAGDLNRGAEVIKALEDNGGVNKMELLGRDEKCLYCVRKGDNLIVKFPYNIYWLLSEVYELKVLPMEKQSKDDKI